MRVPVQVCNIQVVNSLQACLVILVYSIFKKIGFARYMFATIVVQAKGVDK